MNTPTCHVCNKKMVWSNNIKWEEGGRKLEGWGFMCETCDHVEAIEDDGDRDYDFHSDLSITEQS